MLFIYLDELAIRYRGEEKHINFETYLKLNTPIVLNYGNGLTRYSQLCTRMCNNRSFCLLCMSLVLCIISSVSSVRYVHTRILYTVQLHNIIRKCASFDPLLFDLQAKWFCPKVTLDCNTRSVLSLHMSVTELHVSIKLHIWFPVCVTLFRLLFFFCPLAMLFSYDIHCLFPLCICCFFVVVCVCMHIFHSVLYHTAFSQTKQTNRN